MSLRPLARWLVLGVLPVAAGCSAGAESTARKVRPPPLVTVALATTRDVAVEARAPLDLRPLAQADIGSKTLGYLDAVLVDRGDPVRRGQLLAVVRPSDLPDQLASARGTLAQTQANLALARANADRARSLAPSGVVSQQELQQSMSAVDAAQAGQSALQAQISALAVRLGETRIASPLDGVVWQRRLDPGALVGLPAGSAILTVVEIDVLRVFIAVGEHQAGRMRIGQSAWVEVDALPGRRFEGKVVRLAPGYDPLTRTLDAEVRIPNPKRELRPGMYGHGGIVLAMHPGAVAVSADAVLVSGTQRYVFVVEQKSGQEIAHRRAIEIGVDGGEWIEIPHGLAAGEEVVTAGADGLADGSPVRVARDVDPYSGERLVDGGKLPAKQEKL